MNRMERQIIIYLVIAVFKWRRRVKRQRYSTASGSELVGCGAGSQLATARRTVLVALIRKLL